MPIVASTDDVTIALHDLGGTGPAMLWCHATGFHGRCYRPLADALPDHRHWALDFRGFGDSTEGSRRPRWQGFAEDVLAVVDHLGLESVHAFGHSKGGAALLLAEMTRPGTFASLYCFEPIVFPPMPAGSAPSGLAEAALRRRPTFPSYDAALERYGSRLPLAALDPRCLERYVRDGFDERDGAVWLKAEPAWESETYETGGSHGGFARLGEVRCPVTVAASGDGGGPAIAAPMIADELPEGSLVHFDDLGHFGPLEAPERIAHAAAAALWS